MVNTRRSSVGLKAEVGASITAEDSFKTTFSLPSFWKRVDNLSENQKIVIESTGFGNLLKIPCHRLSRNLLAELMERWCPDMCAFLLVPTDSINSTKLSLKINLIDVALILGLRVTGEPVILRDDEPLSELEIEYGATLRDRNITVASIEKRLDSLGDVVNDEFVKLFLLFAFGKLLFPLADSTVDSRYLSLLQSLDKVSGFAWGEAVLKNIIFWLCTKKEKNDQFVGGCLIFLQIWSYEHVDIARPKTIDCETLFPRACRWENTRPQSRQWFRMKFKEINEDQVICKLELTQEESKIDIVNVIYKVDENRTGLENMDQWIAEKEQDSDLEVVREVERAERECSISQDGSPSVVIISEDDKEEENIAGIEQTSLTENTELKMENNSLREEIKMIKDQLKEKREEYEIVNDRLQEKNAEVRKLRDENETVNDQLQEKNAEVTKLREENEIVNNQLQEKTAELDALRKENRFVSSSSEDLLSQLDNIVNESEWRNQDPLIKSIRELK